MRRFVVRFLTKRACPLCEQARLVVIRAVWLVRGEIEEVDIATDATLRESYGERVPVVLTPDGVVVAEGRIEFGVILRRLLAARVAGS